MATKRVKNLRLSMGYWKVTRKVGTNGPSLNKINLKIQTVCRIGFVKLYDAFLESIVQFFVL